MRYGSLSMHRGLFKFVLLATALLPAGCNVVGVVAYKVAGPPKVPAKYVPPKEPMVVLVERYNAPSASVTVPTPPPNRAKTWEVSPSSSTSRTS